MGGASRVKNTDPINHQSRPMLTLEEANRGLTVSDKKEAAKNGDSAENKALKQKLERALIKQPDGSFVYGETGIWLDDIGCHFPEELDQNIYLEFGQLLLAHQDRIQLWIGDWALEARRLYQVDYDAVALQVGRDPDTIEQYVRVCNSVTKPLRSGNLTYSHYYLVASRKYEYTRAELLKLASTNDWTVEEFRNYINPPTPPTDSDVFYKTLEGTSKKVMEILSRAGQGDRKKFIAFLKQWVSELERTYQDK